MGQNAHLPDKVKNAVAQFLMLSVDARGRPGQGKMKEACIKWGIHRSSVHRIWLIAKKQIGEGLPVHIVKMKPASRQPRYEISIDTVLEIQPSGRKTIRALALSLRKKGINISKSTVGREVKLGLFRAHTNSIKPDLQAQNKLLRLTWTIRSVYVDNIINEMKFKSINNIIHIDEKWFFVTQATSRYYLVRGEEPVYRSCKSKNHITKVMFVCAVGRPCYDTEGELIFDGKVGMFPLTMKVPTVRRSKNRAAGTLEIKAITSVTMEVYKDCLINQILPTIKEKWPAHASKDIILQQDNATPHITDADEDFREAATKDGFNFTLVFQPPQSPDCNINDLGWFRAIQSLQQESPSYNIDALIKVVEHSFNNLEPFKLNKVFLTLQSCLVEIMKLRGHNNYRTPHMKKDMLIRQGLLPHDLTVDKQLVKDCIHYLLQVNEVQGLGELMRDLGFL